MTSRNVADLALTERIEKTDYSMAAKTEDNLYTQSLKIIGEEIRGNAFGGPNWTPTCRDLSSA
jgi:hypothetical protein